MIQPTELRLNNWVYSIQLAKEVQVITIEKPEVCFTSDGVNYCTEYDSIEPIPLNEEVLLKCGFEKEFNGCYYDKNRFVIFKNIHNNVVGLNGSDLYCSKVNGVLHLKHLHQLQNLYFALTNQELIYKP